MSSVPSLGPRGEGWVVLQGILLGLAFVAGVAGVVDPAWRGPERIATTVAGLVLSLAGVAQGLLGLRDLGTHNLTVLPHPTGQAELVEIGIYARVRHPMYGGVILMTIGWGLLTASPVAAGLGIALVPFFWLKSIVEERWLEARHPGYAAYRRRTRRFIAWPG